MCVCVCFLSIRLSAFFSAGFQSCRMRCARRVSVKKRYTTELTNKLWTGTGAATTSHLRSRGIRRQHRSSPRTVVIAVSRLSLCRRSLSHVHENSRLAVYWQVARRPFCRTTTFTVKWEFNAPPLQDRTPSYGLCWSGRTCCTCNCHL